MCVPEDLHIVSVINEFIRMGGGGFANEMSGFFLSNRDSIILTKFVMADLYIPKFSLDFAED